MEKTFFTFITLECAAA